MPKYDYSHLCNTYGDLMAVAQGYADALLECQGSCAIGDEWDGIGPDDFAKDTIRRIHRDCERFLRKAVNLHPGGYDGLMLEIDEYDLGFNFYLERQGTGVGFRDRHLDKLGEKLSSFAEGFGWIEVEISDDRKIAFLLATPIATESPSK